MAYLYAGRSQVPSGNNWVYKYKQRSAFFDDQSLQFLSNGREVKNAMLAIRNRSLYHSIYNMMLYTVVYIVENLDYIILNL